MTKTLFSTPVIALPLRLLANLYLKCSGWKEWMCW